MTAPTSRRAARRRGAPVGPVPGIRHERPHWEAGRVVAGVDEVGRGAWAGPVTVGVVALPAGRRIQRLRDSKILPPDVREQVAARVRAVALGVGIGHASNEEIDRQGLSAAQRLAARRALEALDTRVDLLLVDGRWDFLADCGIPRRTLVGGDAQCASIAAASVVAKVARDRLLVEADRIHPDYAFASNKGYPSPAHRAALATHGPCPLHRFSWSPVARLRQPTLFEPTDG